MEPKMSVVKMEKTEKTERPKTDRPVNRPGGFQGTSAMDVPRKKSAARKRRTKTIIYAVLAVAAVAAVTVAVSRMKPAAPGVTRSTVVIDTVRRGSMLRQVRGPGTLVPEQVRVIAASTNGLVERIHVQPGTEVTAGTVLIELGNPEIQQQVVDVEYQVRAAEADLNN